ncbi:MAG: YggS family pyridoxal phosphate-dependent enzyme [Crocinitomicaceae bacterium]|nr:YggS family pyridoxal phosphate-dependent enzyme [Crocinitomicaceae bacterium]
MIQVNLRNIQDEIPENVLLIAVSKTKPANIIQAAYEGGQRDFGENKVQELVTKHSELPADIKWHFIGHLQRNKVKYIAEFVHLIHSVDSLKLLQEINKHGKKHNRTIRCLLQFNISQEESKFGLSRKDGKIILNSAEYKSMQHIEICGVMGMASFTQDENQISMEFDSLHNTFQEMKDEFFQDDNQFKEVSMGMSGDYKLAIKKGSTMVRVGSLIFGSRI